MPRKAFVADLQESIKTFERKTITELRAGGEDGTINFHYHTADGSSTEVTCLVPDLGDYPQSHDYMFYTNSENVPQPVHSALDSMDSCHGLKVLDMMCKAAKVLDKATAGSRHNPVDVENGDPMVIDSDDEAEESDDQEDYDSDADPWSSKSPPHGSSAAGQTSTASRSDIQNVKARIRQDLARTKEAGFRIGHLGSLMSGGQDGFITVSCRVSKLGISDEALQAWHMEPSHYFILLIKYTAGYRDLDRLVGSATTHAGSGVGMRVGLSERYRIAIDEAIAAFAQLEDKSRSRKLMKGQAKEPEKSRGFNRVFIGRPLEELLNERLVPLLKYRLAMGLPWGGAEDFFNDHQGRNLSAEDAIDNKYWAPDTSHQLETLPKIVTNDHLDDSMKHPSFPLLAMQYALRHLVRCTEFCLVCHCKVEADFEALKPYVCSKPLCLYQYMSLGFGPSIEHEIITQPYVVDLLVSFCYVSACHHRLRNLPTGMALMVPSIEVLPQVPPTPFNHLDYGTKAPKKNKKVTLQTYKAKFNEQRLELIFDIASQRVLHEGNWVTFVAPGPSEDRYHCRVVEVLHPTVRLGTPIIKKSKRDNQTDASAISTSTIGITNSVNRVTVPSALTPATTPSPMTETLPMNQNPQIEFCIYDQNFDELEDIDKQNSIVMLLGTLPSVSQMGAFVRGRGGQDSPLRSWVDRISPATLGLLRWIIASHRSCIIQVDNPDGSTLKPEERVSGMPNWMQFRFAQGAPDKEQRFVTSIRTTTRDSKYPTMFAWHGSPLYNWHGIVREGLHFENADHGRAFGNGCYHSLQCVTSMGYSGRGFGGMPGDIRFGEWPNSQLKITQAIALNEIVNAPTKFISKSPHLVVAQLDWIQSRYLFVRCGKQVNENGETTPSQVYEQDPDYTPIGEKNAPIVIPVTAVSKSRRPISRIVKTGNKKVKVDNVQDLEEAANVSEETDIEDLEIFLSDAENEFDESSLSKGKHKALPELPSVGAPHRPKTDFKPGSLDHKSLPLLEAPSYATSMATKALQRELTATLKVQDTHPSHELGWYVDSELITNVYQWIIELHSFEAHLPLAKDLKSKGITSVVLEIRFGKNYPMSPPFVRVIRPRFLSFMHGGGGHVTAGGALCMELLTNSGWSAVSNIESVLLQVRLAMSSTEPKPARLEAGPVRDYSVGEAVEAFVRACNAHGWEVPSDFKAMNYAASSTRDR